MELAFGLSVLSYWLSSFVFGLLAIGLMSCFACNICKMLLMGYDFYNAAFTLYIPHCAFHSRSIVFPSAWASNCTRSQMCRFPVAWMLISLTHFDIVKNKSHEVSLTSLPFSMLITTIGIFAGTCLLRLLITVRRSSTNWCCRMARSLWKNNQMGRNVRLIWKQQLAWQWEERKHRKQEHLDTTILCQAAAWSCLI